MVVRMNPEIKELWATALESGEYQQCKNALTTVAEDGSKTHCCLGVLAELAVKAGAIEPGQETADFIHDERATVLTYDRGSSGESKVIPLKVMDWAGMTSNNPSVEYDGYSEYTLATLNDGAWGFALTFPQIAQVIREQL